MKEMNYIRYRKMKAFVYSLGFYLCRIMPIENNLISVCTFEGKGGFGCNPKYIVEKLHDRAPYLKFVWFVNEDCLQKKHFPSYIKIVPNTTWRRIYWLSRSKVWIDNYRKSYGTKKRRGQLYINTWHGMSGFKSIGLWRGKAFSQMAYLVSRNDSDMVDYFLCDSKFTKDYFPKGLLYNGPFLQVGSPRCDILIKKTGDCKQKFYKRYGLERDAKCIMFAPTYREGVNEGKRNVYVQPWSIDFERLISNLQMKFGGEWYLVLRLHPQITTMRVDYGVKKIIDISDWDDMYEALAAMDAFITDYSSCAMDAAMLKIPVFIYADDIEKYINDRGTFTWEINRDSRDNIGINKELAPNIDAVLPFRISKNNEELEEDVLTFKQNIYETRVSEYEKAIELIKTGDASQKTTDFIMDFLKR